MRNAPSEIGSHPQRCLFEWKAWNVQNYFCSLLSRTEKKKSGFPRHSVFYLHVGCNLHLFGCVYWQAGQGGEPQYYTSSCTNFSSLLLKWCCCCSKLETELIMNQVNRSQDPILPGITFKWLCPGIEVASAGGNPTNLQLERDGFVFSPIIVSRFVPVSSPLVFHLVGP